MSQSDHPAELPRQPEPASGLFRGEALAAQQAQWLGTVLLAPRLSHRLFALIGGCAAIGIVALLVFGQFTRTSSLSGWLVPQRGVMQVVAPRAGVVTALHVKEGATVRQGQPLLSVSDELQTEALGGTETVVAQRLAERIHSLREALQHQQSLLRQQQASLAERVAALGVERSQIEQEIAMLRARVEIAANAEKLQRQMRDQGFIAEPRYQQARSDLLAQQAGMGALERNRTTIERERLVADAELRDLPLKSEQEVGLLTRNLAELEQERAQSEARREIVVSAPQDGVVTAIGAVLGSRASPSTPLLSIVPQDAQLQAHLYGPSRAIGFLRPGQAVRLRYRAYPYQRFGHQDGVLASVSRVAIGPGELPPPLVGVVGTTGAGGTPVTEPVYRLTVSLARQSIVAYGEAMPLQSGMLLEADVKLERRSLLQWALDPLYTLTGKWQ